MVKSLLIPVIDPLFWTGYPCCPTGIIHVLNDLACLNLPDSLTSCIYYYDFRIMSIRNFTKSETYFIEIR